MLNLAERPSSEGEAWFSTMEKIATGPFAFAPAQTVQLAQPVIWSISLLTVAVEGGVGKAETGVGVGVGDVPLTVRERGALKNAPVESQACTTTQCVPDAIVTKVSSLLAETR